MSIEQNNEIDIVTRPKPTWYSNYYFRSKLEAKWAVFFDKLKVNWTYEPEPFLCEDGTQYTPDFYLPNAILRNGIDFVAGEDFDGKDAILKERTPGVFIEVKPSSYTNDKQYEKRIASSGSTPLILLVGDPIEAVVDVQSYSGVNLNIQLSPYWDNCMVFMYCNRCGSVKFDYDEGNYYQCPSCGQSLSYSDPTVSSAAEFARNFRFQFYDPRNK